METTPNQEQGAGQTSQDNYKQGSQDKYIVGCYGGRRGTSIAALTNAMLAELRSKEQGTDISMVLGRGHEGWIGDKAGTHISNEHADTLEQIAGKYAESDEKYKSSAVKAAIEQLRQTGRRAATKGELQGAKEVLTVDAFIGEQYRKTADEPSSGKYQTILEAAGMSHKKYGLDMDDTEVPVDFVERVVKPKKAGQQGANIKPKEATYYALDGTAYIAGSKEAREHEARDLIEVSRALAERILEEKTSQR